MGAFNIAVVIVLILVGAGLLVLTVLAYRRTGNALLIVYGAIIAIGMISGAIAAWRNLRRAKGGEGSTD